MSHRIDQIVAAIVTTLTTNADVGGAGINVYRYRSVPIGQGDTAPTGTTEVPAVAVYFSGDEPLSETGFDNQKFIDSDLALHTDIWISQKPDTLDVQLLKIRRRVQIAMLAAFNQGLSFVQTTIPAGSDEMIVESDGGIKTAMVRMNWIIRFRQNIDDPGDGALEAL